MENEVKEINQRLKDPESIFSKDELELVGAKIRVGFLCIDKGGYRTVYHSTDLGRESYVQRHCFKLP